MKRVPVLVVALAAVLCFALPLVGCSAGQQYTPQLKEQTVDDSALNTAGTLRVGVNASNAPYSTSTSGTIVGIDVDIAAALADQMGLKLELVDVGQSTDTAFTKDNVDIVMGVSKENDLYWLSDSYLSSGVVLFSLTKGAQAPTEAGDFKVAAQSSSMSAIEVENRYGSTILDAKADPTAVFEALKTGEVNYAASDSTIGEYVVHVTDAEAYPIARLSECSDYSVAVAKDNSALQKAVTDALTTVEGGGIIEVIQKSWLGSQDDISNLPLIKAKATTQSNPGDAVDNQTTNSSTTETSTSTTNTESSTSGISGSPDQTSAEEEQ